MFPFAAPEGVKMQEWTKALKYKEVESPRDMARSAPTPLASPKEPVPWLRVHLKLPAWGCRGDQSLSECLKDSLYLYPQMQD